MSLVDTPKIKRATAAMNQVMARLDPREALLMLAASTASVIVSSWREQERQEVVTQHTSAIEMNVQKLTEAIERKKHGQ